MITNIPKNQRLFIVSYVIGILVYFMSLTLAVTPCPTFYDGYCVIDTSNPPLGKPTLPPHRVLIDRQGKVLKTEMPDWSIGQNQSHRITGGEEKHFSGLLGVGKDIKGFTADGKWGLKNIKTGTIVIAPTFARIWEPARRGDPTFVAIDVSGVGSLFDPAGKKICELQGLQIDKDYVKEFPLQLIDGMLCYPKASGWGAIDVAGNEKIPFKYESIGSRGQGGGNVHEGAIRITLGGKVGFVSIDGKVISEPKWDTAGFFSEGLCYVSYAKRWAFLNKNGNVVIGPFEMGPPNQ